MKPSEVLRKALELMDGGEKWCKGEPALDVNGNGLFSSNPDAIRWCSLGAINRTTGLLFGSSPTKDFLKRAADTKAIGDWNDSAADFSVIESGFKKAIALAEEAGQ